MSIFDRTPQPPPGFVVYDPTTGIILRVGSCQPNMELAQAGPGEAALPVDDPFRSGVTQYTHKIDLTAEPPVVVELPLMPLSVDTTTIRANDQDKATISNVPVGAVLWIQDVLFGTITDGVVVFTENQIGTYTLRFTDPAWMPTEVVITATQSGAP